MAPIEKKKGFRHLLAAGGYSFQGFMRLLKEEAFRHELNVAPARYTGLKIVDAMLPNEDVGETRH